MKHSCRTLHMASDDVHCRLCVTLGQTLLMQTLILSFLWYLVNSVLTALLRLHVKTPCAGMCCTLHLSLILTPSPCIYAELCRVAKKTNTKSLPFPAPTMYAARYQSTEWGQLVQPAGTRSRLQLSLLAVTAVQACCEARLQMQFGAGCLMVNIQRMYSRDVCLLDFLCMPTNRSNICCSNVSAVLLWMAWTATSGVKTACSGHCCCMSAPLPLAQKLSCSDTVNNNGIWLQLNVNCTYCITNHQQLK